MSLRFLLLNQLRSITAAGYQVFAVSAPGEDVAYLTAHGIRHHSVPMSRRITPFQDLLAIWRIFLIVRRQQVHIVHTHNPKPGLLGQVAARLAGVPVVVNTIHGFYFTNHTHPVWRWFFVSLEKIAARCSDLIWSQNQEDIDVAVKEGICAPDKLFYLGNGIDLSEFDPVRFRDIDLLDKRRELSLPFDSPVVGFVGRLVSEKGVHELMQAARMVIETYPEVKFLIIGATDFEKRDAITPGIVDQYGLRQHCLFAGQRDDMPVYYALMDVFVLPSHREGFPRSPMEASAMRVPCVVTDIRGCREAVEHGRNGLLVPLGDVQALAEAIIYLLTDKELARQMSDAGRQMALERFDEQEVFAKVKTEYARLLSEKGLPLPEAASPSDMLVG